MPYNSFNLNLWWLSMAKIKLLKIISILFVVSILPACAVTLDQARQGYDRGDYVASIKVITSKLDQKQEYPRDSLKKSWLNVIHLSLNQLEQLPTNTIDQKIQRLEQINKARELVSGGFYAGEFTGFTQRYPLEQLNLDIAKLYYQKGNNIGLNTTESYRTKAEAYEKGLNYAEYLDMRSLAGKYRKEYSTRLAEEYYKYGLDAVRVKNYKSASEYFSKAITIYANYGEYKDARQQFVKYDKLWRTESAANLFSQAVTKEKLAVRKVDYRDVASLYSGAAKVYQPYGDYKNAGSLATAARNKSMITINYNIHQDRGDDYCGSFNSQRLSERFKSKVEAKFGNYPFELTNSYSADVTINIDYSANYKEGRLDERNQVQSIVNAQGTVMKFNQRTESKKNEYELKAEINSKGDLRVNKSLSRYVESEQSKIVYTGNVPDGYRDKTEGTLKDRNGLCSDLISDFERDLDKALDDISRQAMRL